MNKTNFAMLALAALALSACTGPMIMGTDAAITYATKPGAKPDADTKDQIPAHQSWCYATMGEPMCYAHAQDVPPDRLINVDPASAYPLTPHAYRNDVVEGVPAAAPTPLPSP